MVRHTGEDLISLEGVAVASVLLLQAAVINGAKLDAPEADGFSADSDASLGKKIFNIPVAQLEAIAEPGYVADYIAWKSLAFIDSHPPILSIPGS